MSESDAEAQSLDEKLKLLEARRNELVGELGSVGTATAKSAKQLETDTKEAIGAVKNEIKGVTDYFAAKSTEATQSLSNLGKDATMSLSSALDSSKRYAWSIRILWISFCAVLGSLAWLFYKPSLLGVIPLFVTGFAVNELYIKGRKTITNSDTARVAASISTLSQNIDDAAINYLHQRRLRQAERINAEVGYPGTSDGFLHKERYNSRGIGLLLDMIDPFKFADREILLAVVLNGGISWRDFRLETDRRGSTFYFPNENGTRILERAGKDADNLVATYQGRDMSLREAFRVFATLLLRKLEGCDQGLSETSFFVFNVAE